MIYLKGTASGTNLQQLVSIVDNWYQLVTTGDNWRHYVPIGDNYRQLVPIWTKLFQMGNFVLAGESVATSDNWYQSVTILKIVDNWSQLMLIGTHW